MDAHESAKVGKRRIPDQGGFTVLILSQKGQMEKDGQRRCVSRQYDQLTGASGDRLGRLVGALFDLAVMAALLHKVEQLLSEGAFCLGPRGGLVLVSRHCE